MITKEMILGGFCAAILLILAYLFFELLILASRPINWLGNLLG